DDLQKEAGCRHFNRLRLVVNSGKRMRAQVFDQFYPLDDATPAKEIARYFKHATTQNIYIKWDNFLINDEVFIHVVEHSRDLNLTASSTVTASGLARAFELVCRSQQAKTI
ncbi:hypothetical protein PMAYCL1PPCAC_05267, partial [Pristionchus mayeri]